MASEFYPIRTDLAVETQESIKKRNSELRGVNYTEECVRDGVTICRVAIETENAARNMGRPRGEYITIEARELDEDDGEYHRQISEIFGDTLLKMMRVKSNKPVSVLIVGLGNRAVTPDALGPRVIDNLFITRHIMREFGSYAFGNKEMNPISGLVPGVMAQTGMECVEIIRGVVRETKPDYVITIDALAARSTKRLGRTIQITNTGIVPGSGVGNHRNAINRESIGVPVISVGIPTVVDAATIVSDAVHTNRNVTEKLIAPELNGMFVTPKNIDDTVKRLSFLISEGINYAFSKE